MKNFSIEEEIRDANLASSVVKKVSGLVPNFMNFILNQLFLSKLFCFSFTTFHSVELLSSRLLLSLSVC